MARNEDAEFPMTDWAARSLLAGTGWLAETPAPLRDLLLGRAILRQLGPQRWLWRIGERSGGLWGLAAGGVEAEGHAGPVAPRLALLSRPGSWIGESELLADHPAGVGVRTTRPSSFLFVSRASFLAIARSDPEAWRWLARLAYGHLIETVGVLDDVLRRSSVERVASLILRLAEPVRTGLEMRLTQERLAEFAGLSRSSLGDIIGRLAQQGLLELGYRRVRILDVVALQTCAQGGQPDGGSSSVSELRLW